MKRILLAIALMPIISFSQEKEVLIYFKSKDSLFGIKDQAGNIIIPAQFRIFSDRKDGDVVEGETILFDGEKKDKKWATNTWGYVYDRKGNFLYTPFLYDNGPDYFSEGVRRFVENGKMGFVDRNGRTIIPPKHDFVSFFTFGYAEFCDGCQWKKDSEGHKTFVGGKWGVMNFKGEMVQPMAKHSSKDVEINGRYYPYPFQYNGKEKDILQFFEKQNKKLSGLYHVNVYNELSDDQKKLFFEIVERPKQNFPYYQVNTYTYDKKDIGSTYRFQFLASENGKNYYTKENEEDKTPYEEWLEAEIKSAEQFQKEHADNPNKFKNE